MVTIQKNSASKSPFTLRKFVFALAFTLSLSIIFWWVVSIFDFVNDAPHSLSKIRPEGVVRDRPKVTTFVEVEQQQEETQTPKCYTSLKDLTIEERFPKAGKRHIVDPPTDTRVTLVCCQTTAGPWSIAVHHAWAPIGAQRFMDMVTSGYFSNKVPLMRCVYHFLCQFGLAGKVSEQFAQNLPDDPQWLPKGPDNRKNELGVKRFQKGYFSYAGGGKNSRDNQLFVALADNGPLGGGSPWEVPWGELVGDHSYETLDKIYTGYGENGPSQYLLWKEGALDVVRKDFPKIDWIISCEQVDEVESDNAGEPARRR